MSKRDEPSYPPPKLRYDCMVRVRYGETDQMAVAFYARYLDWFEVARTEFMHAIGWPYRLAEERGWCLPVAEVRCRYKAPAHYDDVLRIETRIADWTDIRVTIAYRVFHHESDRLLAEGETLHVWTGMDFKVRRMPPDLKTLFLSSTGE